MRRRDFLHVTGLAAGALALPPGARLITGWHGALTPIPSDDKRRLADAALGAARSAGASYADVRIGRYLNQFVSSRETRIQNVSNTESYGAGVRVIAGGTWGFAASSEVTVDSIARTAREAVAVAKANARLQAEPLELAPQKGYGEVSWKSPIEKNAFEVSIQEKGDLLLAAADAAMRSGAKYVQGLLFLVNEQKYFASTDGSYIDQDLHRIWPLFTATVVDAASGKFDERVSLSAPTGRGWEYLSGRPEGKLSAPSGTGVTLYRKFYDMVEDAAQAGREAREKLKAKPVTAGKYDLVLEPGHLWLTIHESVGHPLELDRVLGYEANYAGTSFATLDKWRSKSFRYGSDLVTLVADKTQPYSLGQVGYDDEGVVAKRWELVKNGTLVNYQAIRDQVHVIGQKESHGCCHADSWRSVQFQRMPNVSLEPGTKSLTPDQLVAQVERGIYVVGDGSYSIDQQRYNFQFGGQLFYEIRNGKIVGMLRDVAYQSNTLEFWNSCVAICDRRDYRLNGSFFDGKGQPPQSSAVSHGSSTARFNGVSVLNTARKI
ncbi:MAG: TldD/PmbA family protein [Gemmatimonadales bacterium]|nr:TldD/PmbA family protein [Gemmatimonadales bacterium]